MSWLHPIRSWVDSERARLAAGSRVASTGQGPIEYATCGDKGPIVLVLHGTPGGYDQGLLFARLFDGQPLRWLAISRPGYLRTPIEVGCTPEAQADALAALLELLGHERAFVMGISGGGPAALQFALRHPERCQGLILISAVTRRRPARQRPWAVRLAYAMVLGWNLGGWLVHGAWQLAMGLPWPNPRRRFLRDLVSTLVPDRLRRAGRISDLQQYAALAEEPPPGLTGPILVVHGSADRLVQFDHAEAVARVCPQAVLVEQPGAGHDLFSRHAESLVPRIAGWIEQNVPGGA